jgi:alkanesulfonate monooxygenase SsuD/methylene tetrahydromethanopterin reductase-like flavin-dependent oxidoreductase (luciferase family)
VPGSQGSFASVRSLSSKQDLTLRDVGKLYARGITLPQIVGTPSQVADALEHNLLSNEADGFMISAACSPKAFEEFVERVVPELQSRKLFRDEYEGSTLREHLGLGPVNLTPVPRKQRWREEFDSED